MCRNFVSYLRVSSAKQGASGLGLEAQQAAVAAFIAGKGADAKLFGAAIPRDRVPASGTIGRNWRRRSNTLA